MCFVPTAYPLLDLVEGWLLQLVNLIEPCAVYLETTEAVEVFVLVKAFRHEDKLTAVVECHHIGVSVPTLDVGIEPIGCSPVKLGKVVRLRSGKLLRMITHRDPP